MMAAIQEILQTQKVCVLSTMAEDRPHTSLMAYICDEECRNIFMVTHKNTKKYTNLKANGNVSLLLDTRDRPPVKREQIMALTIGGHFYEIGDEQELEEIRRLFIKHHGHLEEFAGDKEAVFFKVKITSLQLMKNAMDSFYASYEE